MMLSATIFIGACILAISYLVYLFLPGWDSWLWQVKRQLGRKEKVCCLTFDDGPSKDWTPQVLDILKKYDLSATFFITGQRALIHPDLVRRIAGEGHEIGNHTMNHVKLPFCRQQTAHKEINSCSEILESIIGRCPTLFRAPHGFKRPGLKRTLKKMNLQLVPWTKGLWDTDMPPADELLRRLNKKFHPLEILLLHDGIDNRPIPQNRDRTIEALPRIIEEYKNRGYKFSVVSDLRTMTNDKIQMTK